MSAAWEIKERVKNQLKQIAWIRKSVAGLRQIGVSGEKKYNILLLTNRDSDNVGDQIMEACDVSLISAIMENLGIAKSKYVLVSKGAGIVTQKYLATRDPKFLTTAEKLIEEADVIIFGGAPVFNYGYQTFYERTAVTIELAKKHNKPIIFSAVGVEKYEEDREECRRIKTVLNMDCVKQVTTRDDMESLGKYIWNERIVTGVVSDPAVFASKVFERFSASKRGGSVPRIGIFVLRENGFKNNKVDFSGRDAEKLWSDIIRGLQERGYEYEALTSGHFNDEAFLDYLVNEYGFDKEKCVFNMNTPEDLIRKITSYSAVISCRLHPGIVSYSFGIPSVGIVWNPKVSFFYNLTGNADRALTIEGINAETVLDRMEQAMTEGVSRDEKYIYSVYESLFRGMKEIFCADSTKEPYTYTELMKRIPVYRGTSEKEREEKLQRKFRRIYGRFNELFYKQAKSKETIKSLRAQNKKLRSRCIEKNTKKSEKTD